MPRQKKYPDELLDRGARMVADSGRPIAHVARDLGIHHESLRKWVRKAEADAGVRKDLLNTEEREELKALRGEVRELRRANDILKSASAFFAAELDPRRTKCCLPGSLSLRGRGLSPLTLHASRRLGADWGDARSLLVGIAVLLIAGL